MNLRQIQQDEQQYVMHTYNRFNVALVSGKGAIAKDTDGREYIDFTSGIGVNCLGYSDSGWVEAVTRQAKEIQHTSNLYYSPVQTQLAKKLCTATGFDKVFFANSGAEANECAITVLTSLENPAPILFVWKIPFTEEQLQRFPQQGRMFFIIIFSRLQAAFRLQKQTTCTVCGRVRIRILVR